MRHALTKAILTRGQSNPFAETPDQVVRRVYSRSCREEEHRRHQRRGTPLLSPEVRSERRGDMLTGDERTRSRETRRRKLACGFPALSRQEQDRREGDLRPVRNAVLSQGLRLFGRHALSVGRIGFFARRCNRERHRQSPEGARCGRFDDRRAADLPRSLAPNPRGFPEEGTQNRHHQRSTETSGGACRERSTASTTITATLSDDGNRTLRHRLAA